jgi:hypothetical protein
MTTIYLFLIPVVVWKLSFNFLYILSLHELQTLKPGWFWARIFTNINRKWHNIYKCNHQFIESYGPTWGWNNSQSVSTLPIEVLELTEKKCACIDLAACQRQGTRKWVSLLGDKPSPPAKDFEADCLK